LLFLLSMSTSMALMDASHLTSVPAMVSMVEGDGSGKRTSDCFDHLRVSARISAGCWWVSRGGLDSRVRPR
jgi:hypothetical protein